MQANARGEDIDKQTVDDTYAHTFSESVLIS